MAVVNGITSPPELVRADYNIYRYTDQIYKIIKFRSNAPRVMLSSQREKKGYDHKLDASISRSKRVVLELALCNEWKYFCTFTISGAKYDRSDLSSWAKKFTQWLRDQRKKYDMDFPYLLVPEQHQDGSWHMHGLFGDISPLLVSFRELWERGENVPFKLVSGGYFNWPDYQRKFGFCSFGEIHNAVAVAFYVTKYICKSLAETAIPVGLNAYYCSRGLNHATFHGDVYGQCGYLDTFLCNHYDFCDTGMTHVKDGCDWSFGLEYMDFQPMESFVPDACCDESAAIDDFFEFYQDSFL